MAIKTYEAPINVLEASKIRIKNIFENGLKVYLSMSGGKDSIVVAGLVYDLIVSGEIDPSLLTVQFVDEEAMYEDVIRVVKNWRTKFMLVGAKFEWYAMQYYHFNSLNQLTADETYMCWDELDKDNWVRNKPSFAIENHPLFNERKENYQAFMTRRNMDGITITGQRIEESHTRNNIFSKRTARNGNLMSNDGRQAWVIYDWTFNDVWLYIRDNNLEFPETYIYLYQVGMGKQRLRISTYFATDTVGSLVHMAEHDPVLWNKILKREPNAYIVALYWDSEMFGRNSRKRTEMEKGNESQMDYRAKLKDIFRKPEDYFQSKKMLSVCYRYKSFYINNYSYFKDKDIQEVYETLMKGDTKSRGLRSLQLKVGQRKGDIAREIIEKRAEDKARELGGKNE